ncbi:putative S-adenosyl-L-methionine-dependent methyltransferase [Helianthus annuus]|uniref:S-adenosyl-L-methionine-dependent methyltransferase n=1 Tax=Helianthus annuus TaxID=4232 RepID=A0A9K3ENW1_HELAN|nr:putative S-adenosyl-L-methionine-dependent methyltransferase [Helianthus annuus]
MKYGKQAHEKSDQNWMVVKGEKFVFADAQLLKRQHEQPWKLLRTLLDVGCGVASFSGYLLSSDMIATWLSSII